jgi:hypothetical protein
VLSPPGPASRQQPPPRRTTRSGTTPRSLEDLPTRTVFMFATFPPRPEGQRQHRARSSRACCPVLSPGVTVPAISSDPARASDSVGHEAGRQHCDRQRAASTHLEPGETWCLGRYLPHNASSASPAMCASTSCSHSRIRIQARPADRRFRNHCGVLLEPPMPVHTTRYPPLWSK